MSAEQAKKLQDEALYLVGSLANAVARTTTARYSLDVAMHDERCALEKLNEAIKALAKSGQAPGPDSKGEP